MKPLSEARVAIIFEWLQQCGGVERVIAGMRELFPNADLFALICDPDGGQTPIEGSTLHTSFIQRLPWATKKHRYYLPLMPLAVEQFDLRSYDWFYRQVTWLPKECLHAPISYTSATPTRRFATLGISTRTTCTRAT